MVVAMARDIRVLVIKLADRLHNMRTLQWLPPEKQAIKARETLEIYAPLAHRLGMNTVKWELEDLSFATLHPKMYEEIVRLVGQRAPAREQYLEQVIGDIDERLRAARIRATVTGRPKHYYSVYQKMIVRGHDFSDIYDLVGVRILVDSVRDCYAVLGTLHAAWNPLPGRFKDYIAMPKFNMYQSLHTTVIGPDGKPVEVQIRTHEMHRSAEYGIAAHWRYKQTEVGGKLGPDDLGWLRQLVEWQRETEDPGEFLESLRYDLGSTEVFVFTPRGDVIALPSGSTPVDFAYAVHTELGHRCVGARVNGRLVPLDSPLSNGDAVEVFTSKAEGAGPSLDWLTFVRSPRARSKIKAWFSRERREEAIDKGKDQLLKAMRKEGVSVHRLLSTTRPGHGGRRPAPARRQRPVRLDRRGPDQPADGDPPPGRHRRGRGRGRRRCRRGGHAAGHHEDAPALGLRPGRDRDRLPARRRLGQAGPLLHAGARRRDHRLRHPRQRGVGAPPGLHQRRRRWPGRPSASCPWRGPRARPRCSW